MYTIFFLEAEPVSSNFRENEVLKFKVHIWQPLTLTPRTSTLLNIKTVLATWEMNFLRPYLLRNLLFFLLENLLSRKLQTCREKESNKTNPSLYPRVSYNYFESSARHILFMEYFDVHLWKPCLLKFKHTILTLERLSDQAFCAFMHWLHNVFFTNLSIKMKLDQPIPTNCYGC